jgi:hypothetical protein
MKAGRWLVCLALAGLVGCTMAPVRNVSDAAVVTGSGKAPTVEQVRSSIVRAGTALGWMMTPNDPGVVVGRIALRGHSAVVEVRYTAKDYSITYKDSTNLEYRDGQIHKNYNGWIENLNRDIRTNLLAV